MRTTIRQRYEAKRVFRTLAGANHDFGLTGEDQLSSWREVVEHGRKTKADADARDLDYVLGFIRGW